MCHNNVLFVSRIIDRISPLLAVLRREGVTTLILTIFLLVHYCYALALAKFKALTVGKCGRPQRSFVDVLIAKVGGHH